MVIYIVIFAIIILSAIPLVMKNPTKVKKAVYLGITFSALFIISVFRHGIGSDYFVYIRIFGEISEMQWGEMLSGEYEPLFTVLTKLMTLFISTPEAMYAVYAVLILTPIAVMIYRHSDNVWLSVTVYYCMTLFLNSLNFIRQSLAVSVLILAYGFMKRKKVVPVLILAVVALLFHYTAAIFIPAYLMSLVKPSKKYLIIYGSVSVGVFAVVMTMTALGANPVNLVAELASSLLGRNYSGYIDSIWFMGLGPEYLVMPLTVAAIVLISYFCGWKKRPEADMLLQLTLFNTTIWLFIVYAFILERFSMFVMIFWVFAIPSICAHFADEAKASKPAVKADRNTPGYSKKASAEKSDNSVLVTAWITIGMFVYCCFGMSKNFHYVYPYVCNIPQIEDAMDGIDSPEKYIEAAINETGLYSFLIDIRNSGCGYIMYSSTNNFAGITPAVLRASDYAGIDLRRLTDDPSAANGTIFFHSPDGSFHDFADNSTLASNGYYMFPVNEYMMITDHFGQSTGVNPDRLAFILLDQNGNFINDTEFDVSSLDYAKMSYTVEMNG